MKSAMKDDPNFKSGNATSNIKPILQKESGCKAVHFNTLSLAKNI